MDHFGQIELAATAFELAKNQGYISREGIVRFLACSLVLDRKEQASQLMKIIPNYWTKTEAGEILTEALELIEKIIGFKLTEPRQERLQETPKEEDIQTISNDRQDEAFEILVTYSGSSTQQPYFNLHFYKDQPFSIDFYYYPDAPDYIEQFMLAWREAMRNPKVRSWSFTLRTTLFYFTICPMCASSILTNRDHGEKLMCRRCQATYETFAVERDDLDTLIDKVLAALGKKLVSADGTTSLLIIQPPDERLMERITAICQDAGFIQVTQMHFVTLKLFREGVHRGILQMDRKLSIWQITSNTGYQLYANETPPEISQVLQSIRKSVGPVSSISTTLEQTSFESLFERGNLEEVEARLRQEYQDDPDNPEALMSLTQILIMHEKLEEAREKALVATYFYPNNVQSWNLLGQIEIRCGRWQEAAEAYEKVLMIDPVDLPSVYALVTCYHELGNTDKERAMLARWHSLGGDTIPIVEP